MSMIFSRRGRAAFALAGVLALAMAGAAEARPGGKSGGGFGSRGSRTYDAPAATRTAPSTAAPIQRTQTTPSQVQPRPGAPVGQTAQQPRRFGFGTGLMAGLLGAGLLGALFGGGFFGGLGGIASFLGLLMQVALIGGLIYLAVRFFRRRSEPQPAYAGADGYGRSALGGMGPTGPAGPTGAAAGSFLGGLGGGAASPVRRERSDEVGIGPQDYAAFEKTLHDVQTAYGREDVAALWNLATPEMAGYFQEELNDNARNNAINKISDVRLLQGDLAEAWREGPTDYASVAMHYTLKDVTLDRTTGRVVEGDRDRPQEVTEVWTFRRDNGGPWKVSAIQQAE
ncbi:MAG TPA: TIM44-like domain-containing protein [Beijerinckiaceae bacterium]|jgi:predicted lipid-binding transport protein (Tim44 family)